MLLCDLLLNQKAKIINISLPNNIKARFFDIGLREECDVIIVRFSPFKDLIEIKANETFLAIRVLDSKYIEVKLYE